MNIFGVDSLEYLKKLESQGSKPCHKCKKGTVRPDAKSSPNSYHCDKCDFKIRIN